MEIREMAKMLGRRGGLSRARRLPGRRRAEIARMGGRARAESLRATDAIRTNFDYLASMHPLHLGRTSARSPRSTDRFRDSIAVTRRTRRGRRQVDFISAVGELLNDLAPLGYEPTLVGGMALVTLGSSRVTKGFDFLVVEEAREEKALVQVFYRHGFELVSATDADGNVARTIDHQRLALARLRIDRPKSVYFYNRGLGLRVDLLFDFPIPAREVRRRSTRRKIQSYPFHIASRDDLIRMKEIAANARGASSDRQDLEFLKKV